MTITDTLYTKHQLIIISKLKPPLIIQFIYLLAPNAVPPLQCILLTNCVVNSIGVVLNPLKPFLIPYTLLIPYVCIL